MPDATEMNHDELAQYCEVMVELDKRKCQENFAYFVWRSWDIIEPGTKLEWNWHLDLLCEILQREAERISRKEPKTRDICINVPPRSLKSTIISKCFQPWVWTWDPTQRFLTASYEQGLAFEHSVDSRNIVQSDWYQERWGDVFKYTGDQNAKAFHKNDKMGYRMATSVGGSGTGRGGDYVIVDDAQSASEAESELKRANVNSWWDRDMSTRLNDQRIGLFISVQQRLHENDLTGHILVNLKDEYFHICLPAEESDDIQPPELRKHYVDGKLFPGRMDDHYLKGMLKKLRAYGYAGQFMQRPSPPEGGIFKRQWWRFWKPAGMQIPSYEMKVGDQTFSPPVVDLPDRFDDSLCSWDMAFKKADDTDFVVGQVWGCLQADKFLLDQVRERLDFPETVEKTIELKARHPHTNAIIIEAKANGQAVIDQIKRDVPGVIGVNPQGSKTARAMPLSKQANAGNIYLPHPAIAPWVEGFIERFAAFPNVAHDDEIDSASQAIIHLSGTERVWPDYHGQNFNFKVPFDKLEVDTKLLCSQWVTKDSKCACILALWNPKKRILAIFDELLSPILRPEHVLVKLSERVKEVSNGYSGNMRGFMWYANSPMFSNKELGSMRALYRKYNVSLTENRNYDEFAAREFVARLLSRKNIMVHTRCTETIRQMSGWSLDAGKPTDGFPICNALTNIASVLSEGSLSTKGPVPYQPYSVRSTELLTEMQNLANSGNFEAMSNVTRRISKNRISKRKSRKTDKNSSGWMSHV